MGHDVSCVIPRWGRTFVNTMRKLLPLSDESTAIEEVITIVTAGKEWAASDPRETWQRLLAYKCPYLTVAPDRKRNERYFRPGFMGMDLQIGDIRLRLEGDEPHNGSSLIKLDEVDFTIVGLDELLALNHNSLSDPRLVTKWGIYNYYLNAKVDLRIAGSANLTSMNSKAGKEIMDFIGFFLISNCEAETFNPDWRHLKNYRMPVFVKGRYKEMVRALLPGLNTVSTSNVEEAVDREEVGIGIEIVQSGSTVFQKGLRVFGRPLFLSESLYVADYRRYLRNEKFRILMDRLSPLGYFDADRVRHYTEWFMALEANLGDSWINKPEPDALFCSLSEIRRGLRPYRLKTRRWLPSDYYKREEAEDIVAESLGLIRSLYGMRGG